MYLMSLMAAGMVAQPQQSAGGGHGAPAADLVEITISFEADTGKPRAEPDSARVLAGGTIVWRSTMAFSIVPKLLWQEDSQKVARASKKNPQGVEILEEPAGSVEGRYPYGIFANGHDVDPDVVIVPH